MPGKVKVGRIDKKILEMLKESPAIMLLSEQDFNGGEPTYENLVGRAKFCRDYLESQGKIITVKPLNGHFFKLVEIK